MHISDAFIQSDLQCIQAIHLLSVCVFPGNRTHNLCAANAMLHHWATETLSKYTKYTKYHIYQCNLPLISVWSEGKTSLWRFIPKLNPQSGIIQKHTNETVSTISPNHEPLVIEASRLTCRTCARISSWQRGCRLQSQLQPLMSKKLVIFFYMWEINVWTHWLISYRICDFNHISESCFY